MKFKPGFLVETPPPDPLEAAVTEADRLLEDARREAESAAARVSDAEARHRQAASDLDAERVRVRAEEERKTIAERVNPFLAEISDLDEGIRSALEWLRSGIERRERLVDRAQRIATDNLSKRPPAGLALPGTMGSTRLRTEGYRCYTVAVELEYSLEDPRTIAQAS